jgi:hypothetical protein
MFRFVTRPTLTTNSNSYSQHEFWNPNDSCLPEQLRKENAIRERNSLRDSPRHYVSAGTARRILHLIWREVQEWTVIAVNSAETMATAAMNILMLSVVAVFAALAVLILLIRDQVMDRSPAPAVSAPAQLQTSTKRREQTERLT